MAVQLQYHAVRTYLLFMHVLDYVLPLLIALAELYFHCLYFVDRDLMYTKWVEAVSKNAQTVNEIWIEIQVRTHHHRMNVQ